jgi:hypothetical protein
MDPRIQDLVSDLERGYLTRRGFMAKAARLGLSATAATGLVAASGARMASAQVAAPAQVPAAESRAAAQAVQPKMWQQGRGWGWVWGPEDQLGNLNELSPELTLKALSLVSRGRV